MKLSIIGSAIGISMVLYILMLTIVSAAFVVGWLRAGMRWFQGRTPKEVGISGPFHRLWDRELDG